MPKTVVFGKGELGFFLFHALRVAVDVDPYEPEKRKDEKYSVLSRR